MNQTQAGRIGGNKTKRKYGLEICSECGRFKKTSHFSDIGQKGGNETLRLYGSEHFRRIGEMGGRGNKKGE